MSGVDLARLVKPLDFVTDFYGDAKAWRADNMHGRFVYGVDFSGKFYTQTPDGETDQPSLQSAHDFVHSAYAARVLGALDGELLAELVDFLGDFGSAKIYALRHDRGRSSPEDDPDPVVEAEPVWGWQEDARAILAKLGVLV